jgi:hypothetical protein
MQGEIVPNYPQHARRAVVMLVLIVPALVIMTMLPNSSQAATPEGLVNGGFESGFVNQPHCRWRSDLYGTDVGAGWNCFTNQGAARYGFYADKWPAVVADGNYSQLIEINTWGLQSGDNDRYAGIYQIVATTPGAEYRFSMRGMIRSTNLEGDPWRYRVQVGYVSGVNEDWRDVENWTDVGWDKVYPRTEPGVFSNYQTTIRPSSDQMTLFVRVWKKWGLTNEEIDVNLDTISLAPLEDTSAE